MNYFETFGIDKEEFIQEQIEKEKKWVGDISPLGLQMWELTKTSKVLYVIHSRKGEPIEHFLLDGEIMQFKDIFSARYYFKNTINLSEHYTIKLLKQEIPMNIYFAKRLLEKRDDIWPPQWPLQQNNDLSDINGRIIIFIYMDNIKQFLNDDNDLHDSVKLDEFICKLQNQIDIHLERFVSLHELFYHQKHEILLLLP